MRFEAMSAPQPSLFDLPATAATLPGGLRYQPDAISTDEEAALAARLADLPFEAFDFHGFKGHRRVVYFGWSYDFSRGVVKEAEPIPDFLLPFRERAAAFAGLSPDDLKQLLINQYPPGAGIGWHRDRPQFDKVIGLSLLSPCVMRLRLRLRLKDGDRWRRAALPIAPRSLYLFDGPARTDWQHSIVPGDTLRYSVTFRSLR